MTGTPKPPPLDPIEEADEAINFAAHVLVGMLERSPHSATRLSRLHVDVLVATNRAGALTRARAAASPAPAPTPDPEPEPKPAPTYTAPLERPRRSRSPRYVP